MVDLYHEMYIKALLNLFDKYKSQFGLKESDVLHIQWEADGTFWMAPSSECIRFLFPVTFIQSAQLCTLHSLGLCLAKTPCPSVTVGSCCIISRLRTRCLFSRWFPCLDCPSGGRWFPVARKQSANDFSNFSWNIWRSCHIPRAPTMQPFIQEDQKPKETLNQRALPAHWQGGLRCGCTPVVRIYRIMPWSITCNFFQGKKHACLPISEYLWFYRISVMHFLFG